MKLPVKIKGEWVLEGAHEEREKKGGNVYWQEEEEDEEKCFKRKGIKR